MSGFAQKVRRAVWKSVPFINQAKILQELQDLNEIVPKNFECIIGDDALAWFCPEMSETICRKFFSK